MSSISQIMKENLSELKLQKSDDSSCEMIKDTTLPKCDICNEPVGITMKMFGKIAIYPCNCRCKREAIEKRETEEREKEIQKRLDRFIKYSIMDDDFWKCTFDKFVINHDTEKMYKLGIMYCKKWETIYKENKGLVLYGTTGNGKTFLSSCIANELIKRKISVLAISSIGILKRIQESYNTEYREESEMDMIQMLKQASLLIIDDLGAEYKASNKDWTERTLYSIIDARYRSKKPVIITTNLSPENLEKALVGTDGVSRTYSRLQEMGAFMKIAGSSKREILGKKKHEELLKLLEL